MEWCSVRAWSLFSTALGGTGSFSALGGSPVQLSGSVFQQSLSCPGCFSADLCRLCIVIHVPALAFNDHVKWYCSHSSQGQLAKPCVFQETVKEWWIPSVFLAQIFLLQVFYVKGPGLSRLHWLTCHVFSMDENISAFIFLLLFDFRGLISGTLKNLLGFLSELHFSLSICLCVFHSPFSGFSLWPYKNMIGT